MANNTPIQKIIFGSPGTGKSHLIDSHIIPTQLNIKTPEDTIKTVFHPEYSHGDFIGKLLPITRHGRVEYRFYEGHFLQALGQAYKNHITSIEYDKKGNITEKNEVRNVVLVIDEINRGNSSAIFGSIFQLLDRDPSGWSSYSINLNEMAFLKLLELMGIHVLDNNGIEYSLPPHKATKDLSILQKNIDFLKINLETRTIRIPPNLSIIATMNTSDNSIYYMDSAFKRRWDWEFIDIESNSVNSDGIAFKTQKEWFDFIRLLNEFIRENHRQIRGIEDKQIGKYFIKEVQVTKSSIQSKLMFFLWDSVFSRDKSPLSILLYGKDNQDNLITFGDFAAKVDIFIEKIQSKNV
jgi:5-methylcytosine-specific restriction endonuclease McrBC GTP-binding regulatory subunit McrB